MSNYTHDNLRRSSRIAEAKPYDNSNDNKTNDNKTDDEPISKSKTRKDNNKYFPEPLVDLYNKDVLFILIDIETTGFAYEKNRIIQLAAKVLGKDSKYSFNVYVKPVDDQVSDLIYELTGISQTFLNEVGVPFKQAYICFKNWIQQQINKNKQVVMIAHNGKQFDYDFITAEVARQFKIDSWTKDLGIHVLCDSLSILREDDAWIDIEHKPDAFSQKKLFDHLFQRDLNGQHNAIYDVQALEEILQHPYVDSWRSVGNKKQFLLNEPNLRLQKELELIKNNTKAQPTYFSERLLIKSRHYIIIKRPEIIT